jgi:hypothetical protein
VLDAAIIAQYQRMTLQRLAGAVRRLPEALKLDADREQLRRPAVAKMYSNDRLMN